MEDFNDVITRPARKRKPAEKFSLDFGAASRFGLPPEEVHTLMKKRKTSSLKDFGESFDGDNLEVMEEHRAIKLDNQLEMNKQAVMMIQSENLLKKFNLFEIYPCECFLSEETTGTDYEFNCTFTSFRIDVFISFYSFISLKYESMVHSNCSNILIY